MTDDERDAMLISNSEKLESLHKQLLGNGQPGRMDKIETRVASLEVGAERVRGAVWAVGIMWTFVIGVVTAGLEFLFHRK